MRKSCSASLVIAAFVLTSGCKRSSPDDSRVKEGQNQVVAAAGCPPLAPTNLESVICDVLTDPSSTMILGPYTAPGQENTSPDAATGLRVVSFKQTFPQTTAYVITFWEYAAGRFSLRQNADSLRVHFNEPGNAPRGRFAGQTFAATTGNGALTGLTPGGQNVGGIDCGNCHNFNPAANDFRRSFGTGVDAMNVARQVVLASTPEGEQPDPALEAQVAQTLGDLRTNFSMRWNLPQQ